MESWDNLSDTELLSRIQEGSHFAFTVLVKRNATRFYRLAYRFTSNREAAEDIVQDSFLKLWERPDTWKAEKNVKFTTWFSRIVINRALDRKKKKTPLPLDDKIEVQDTRAGQEKELQQLEVSRKLETEISKLPERQRTALNLCFYEEYSNQEAADIMGLNLKALQSLVMRAKVTLKDKMEKYG